jgi:hypothetical protein
VIDGARTVAMLDRPDELAATVNAFGVETSSNA